MREVLIQLRNLIARFVYKAILRRIYFRIDPEDIHDRMLRFGNFLGTNIVSRGLTALAFSYSNKSLEQKTK